MKRLSFGGILPVAITALLLLDGCSDPGSAVGPGKLISSRDASRIIVPAIGTYSEVAAGWDNTCALRNDGVVRCFNSGQVKLEKTTQGGFTAVRNSYQHACALRADGGIECWGGTNQYGEAPALVTPPSGTTFVDLDVTTSYSCALRSDHVIQCWGNNVSGSAPASRVASNGVFTAVAVGGSVTCGLTNFGVMECFGGYGDVTWSPSVGSVIKMVVGGGIICGIRTGGVVECRTSPGVQHTPLSGTFIDYEMNGNGECGVTVAGIVNCGGPYGGGLDDGNYPATQTAVTGSFTRISLGTQTTCALRTDGGIECFGYFAASFGAAELAFPTATFTAPSSVIVGQPIPLSLTNAQVPGYSWATTFTYAFDCGSGTFSPTFGGTASTTSCPTSSTGTRVVRGRVFDQGFTPTDYSATVTIKTAQQGTADLVTEIQSAPLSPDIRKALLAKLDAALGAIAKGKTSSACSAFKDFINQVNAQTGKAIPTATANGWILTAQQLMAAIGC